MAEGCFTLQLDLILRTVDQDRADSVQIVIVAAPEGSGASFGYLSKRRL